MISRRTRVVGLSVLLGVVLAGAGAARVVDYLDDQSAYAATLKWARLAPYPASARHRTVEVTGGMFTRGFVVDFDAPVADLHAWLLASPGATTAGVAGAPARRHYSITPGGGAMFAEMTVDFTRGHVRIRTYWS